MRLVDADALKEPLELQRASYVRIGAIERAEAYANCLWEIAQAPTVGGWISVEDRLPDANKRVLVAADFSGVTDVDVAMYCGNGIWESMSGVYPKFSVNHWCNLPEPPGGERDGIQ